MYTYIHSYICNIYIYIYILSLSLYIYIYTYIYIYMEAPGATRAGSRLLARPGPAAQRQAQRKTNVSRSWPKCKVQKFDVRLFSSEFGPWPG